MATEITYNATPTGTAFHLAPAGYEFKGVRGPVGSGKSVMCCFDIFLKAREQQVAEIVEGGVRKRIRWSNFLIGRHTFPALQKTTIPTWLRWFGPKTEMHWGQPLSGRYEDWLPDGTLLRIDLVFAALESKNILNDLMSLELSGAFVNEATQVPWRVIDRIHDRIGRFQPREGVFGDSYGVIMDTNSPDETNWWYRFERVEKPDKMLFFVQPPALLKRTKDGKTWYEPNDGRDYAKYGILPAENVEHLKEGFYYWEKQTKTKSEDDIKKLILNEFGTSIDGRPVYPEWRDNFHYRNEPIPFQRGLTLLLGSDFGRTPATVIAQMGIDGVLYVLDEVRGENMGSEQFIEELLRPKLMNEYGFPSCPLINFGDPAGMNSNEVVNISAIQKFNQYGILTKPAPATNGNRVQIRVDTVSELLRRFYNGRAAVQVSSKCEFLRKGFNGHYCYRRIRTGVEGDERYTEEPDKNEYSHIHDAFQYLCMGAFKSGVDYSMPTEEMRSRRNFSSMTAGCDFGCV
jgi:hypothetical protein